MRKNNKKLLTSLFILLLLFIGIVYAYLTSNLSITGATEIAANSWDIHFANLQVTEGSVEAITPATISSSTVDITYSIKLNRPKQFYEFTVDVVNEGTLPGKVSISEVSGITGAAAALVDYKVTYTSIEESVAVGDILNGGATKRIRVRVYYRDDIEPNDLPNSNINLTITYTLQYVQSDEDEELIDDLIQDLSTNNSCFTKYTGQVTDQVGQTVTANNVYINNCEDKRNIIFGGYCWQVLRTTESGGLKLIYNGKAVNNKCESTRSNQAQIINGRYIESYWNKGQVMLGSSFDYDLNTGEFTIGDLDENPITLNESNIESTYNKYTCGSTSTTCQTMYKIYYRCSASDPCYMTYTIGENDYDKIAKAFFNTNYPYTTWGQDWSSSVGTKSISSHGYMYNNRHRLMTKSLQNDEVKMGNTFTYDANTNLYTLSGTTQTINDWATYYNTINNTHYTCFNNTGICENIAYVYFSMLSGGKATINYIEMTGGESVIDVFNRVLDSEDVNKYDSEVKSLIDLWYKKNLMSYTNKLEDVVYCNDRTITDWASFNKDGGSTSYPISVKALVFKYGTGNYDLVCSDIKDQFATSNNKAKLTYPIALPSGPEIALLNNNSLRQSPGSYTLLTSAYMDSQYYRAFKVYTGGSFSYMSTDYEPEGVRPSISIKGSNRIEKGTGSESDPWIIESK